ncbi:polyprenyl synthetase family protein [Nonomuraea sp. NPDC005983]|uniref:polyprenyl synthetase family protein n=1 Tax=Nonomuraea sp. NPDC005983 TaxID=3155595 RepID=UPI0033BDC42B
MVPKPNVEIGGAESRRGASGDVVEAAMHDLPRRDCGYDAWRFAAGLRDEGGEQHRLMITFLVHRTTRPDGSPLLSHGCGWTHSMPESAAYRGQTWRDAGAVELICLDTSRGWDPSVGEAVREACSGGRSIAPDRLLPGPVTLAADRLHLDFGGVAEMSAPADGAYHVVLRDDHETWELRLRALKPAVRESLYRGAPLGVDETRSTFLVPRLAADATWTRTGRPAVRMTGLALYQRAFGAAELPQDGTAPQVDHDRTWVALHLDNGWDVVACHSGTADVAGGKVARRPTSVVLVAPDGTRQEAPARLEPGESWTSMTTLTSYPTVWRIDAPQAGLSLRVAACFPEQERHTIVGLGALLEAAATAEGELRGVPVRGDGRLEVQPVNRVLDFERHMEGLREVTHAEVVRLYPDVPEHASITVLAGLAPGPRWPVDVVAEPLHRSLVKPVRHLADAMGKGWRSYAAVAAMEMQGVDSRPYRALTALAELMHTASLIVDDVEDNAPMRRGRPTVHTVFGQATAINTGTHAYLVFDQVVRHLLPDDPERRLLLYQAYLDGMRRNHAGQALDILGHHDVMEAAVATGDSAAVLERVRATHRLKTGGVVRGLGEFGAILAGADGELLAAISSYFETVGLAYQISDDVADLRAVLAPPDDPGSRVAKLPGEDIREGKVTHPLAHAVTLLPRARLRGIWDIVRAGNADPAAAAEVAQTLDDCGATAASLVEARQVVDLAWRPLQELLPVNRHTVMIRALGLYAAQRHLDE